MGEQPNGDWEKWRARLWNAAPWACMAVAGLLALAAFRIRVD